MTRKKAGKKGEKNGLKKRKTKGDKSRQKAPKKPFPKVSARPLMPRAPAKAPTLEPAHQSGGKIFIDKIDRDTVVGDLIVVFPWTREVLRGYGLRLDVEEAGDIYMTLEAFAAIRNLKPDALVRELTDASRQPPQPSQPTPALVTAPTA